jgi:hypothetical protein
MLSFGRAFLGFWAISEAGFPDGGVTEYERAVSWPLQVLMGLHVGLGLCLLHLARPHITQSVRRAGLVIVVVASLCIVGVTEIAIPWYFADHLGLNDGRGG